MINRRLYAMVLLAALALLQVRVAFAGCVDGDGAAGERTAGCCLEHVLPDSAQVLAQPVIPCAAHCLDSPVAAEGGDLRFSAASEFAVPPEAPSRRMDLYPRPPATLQYAANETAHPPHTRLIYILQRLLI